MRLVPTVVDHAVVGHGEDVVAPVVVLVDHHGQRELAVAERRVRVQIRLILPPRAPIDLGIRIENGYGITECGPLISMNADTLEEHLSVGRPCPQLEVKIADPDENGIGELCVRGKSVSKGYYKDPAATAAVFSPDGWFNTGDSARLDAKGRIFLVGRKKNTIVLPSGKNVCPEEVENVIETALDYADDVVVYQAELQVGKVSRPLLCAGLYISDPERRADRTALLRDIGRINESQPAYKRIEYVELPDVPYERTATRKIKRTLLPATCSGEGIASL